MQLSEIVRKNKKLINYLKINGVSETFHMFIDRFFSFERKRYSQLRRNRSPFCLSEPSRILPLISIVIPVYNPNIDDLRECVDSVLHQNCNAWELVICDDHSSDVSVISYLNELAACQSVRVIWHQKNGGISSATNDAIAASTGSYVAFLDNDDILPVDAIGLVVDAILRLDCDFLYTNEDKLFSDGSFGQPFYKPDYSPELLLSCNYVTHLTVVRKSFGDQLGWLRSEFDGSQDYDFALRVFETTKRIAHIPEICYHWRIGRNSVAGNPSAKPYAYESARRALEDALKRRGILGKVVQHPSFLGHYKVLALPSPEIEIMYVLDLRFRQRNEISNILHSMPAIGHNSTMYTKRICVVPETVRIDNPLSHEIDLLHDIPETSGLIHYHIVPGRLCGGRNALLELVGVLSLSDDVIAVTPSIRGIPEFRQRAGVGGDISWKQGIKKIEKFLRITYMDLNNCTRLHPFSFLFRGEDLSQLTIRQDEIDGERYVYGPANRRLVTCGWVWFDVSQK